MKKQERKISIDGNETANDFEDIVEVISMIEGPEAAKEFAKNPYGHCTAEEISVEALARAQGMTVEEWERDSIDEIDQMLRESGIDPDTLEPLDEEEN